MSKVDDAYEDYIFKNNLIWGVNGYNPTRVCLTKEKFIEAILEDDNFYEFWGQTCAKPVSPEQLSLNPNGPKRELI